MVDGVPYFQTELADLLSRGLPTAELLAVHQVKEAFEGVVVHRKSGKTFSHIEVVKMKTWKICTVMEAVKTQPCTKDCPMFLDHSQGCVIKNIAYWLNRYAWDQAKTKHCRQVGGESTKGCTENL